MRKWSSIPSMSASVNVALNPKVAAPSVPDEMPPALRADFAKQYRELQARVDESNENPATARRRFISYLSQFDNDDLAELVNACDMAPEMRQKLSELPREEFQSSAVSDTGELKVRNATLWKASIDILDGILQKNPAILVGAIDKLREQQKGRFKTDELDAISTLAEEIKGDPGKSVGKAALITLMVMGVIFVAQTWIATDLAAGMGFKSADTAFYEIAEIAAGSWLATLTAVATALAWGVAVAITSQAAVSRLLFGMARDGKLPKVLAKVHPKHNTPYLSIYLVAVLSLVICYLFINSVDTLTSLVNFGALSGFMLLHLTVINYYWRRQKSGQVVRHLICPVIGFIIVAAIMVNMGVDAQKLGLIWIALGLVYLFFLNKFSATPALPDPSNG